MRLLAIALLVLNVVYFGVDLNRRLADRPAPAPVPSTDHPSLVLLDELDALPPARATTGEPADAAAEADDERGEAEVGELEVNPRPVAGVPVPVTGGDCWRIGPIERRDEADEIEAFLGEWGLASLRLEQVLGQRRLLWVYLEPTASDAEARERLQRLEAEGLDDYMLINRGGLRNAISLGLFSSQESVNRRLAELADRGYRPVVVPRYQRQRAHWFDIGAAAWEETGLIDADLPVTAALEPATCERVASAPASP